MNNQNNAIKDAVKAYLDNRAKTDELFAVAYAKPHKNKDTRRMDSDYPTGNVQTKQPMILQPHPYQFTGLMDKNGNEIYEGDIMNDPTSVCRSC